MFAKYDIHGKHVLLEAYLHYVPASSGTTKDEGDQAWEEEHP